MTTELDFDGQRVAVLGLSVTGFSVVDTLVEQGAQVLALARAASAEHIDLVGVLGAQWQQTDADDDMVSALEEFAPAVIVVSPGFAPHHPAVQWAAAHAVPLLTDIDIAWWLQRRRGLATKWLAVTGTNGKTTTVEMTTAMLVAGGLRAAYAGNIGVPVLDLVREPVPYDVIVLELSSFQLHYLHSISPWAAVCLNVASDHIDWHGSLQAYAQAKARVYEHVQCACVYPTADERIRTMVEDADVVEGARAIGVTRGVPSVSELGIVEGTLVDRAFLADRRNSALELTTTEALAQHGLALPHLLDDVLAAAALARSLDVAPQAIAAALDEFRTDAHRITPVGEVDGVVYIDDSKATNPHAAHVSLQGFESIVWIAGGLLKGNDLGPLIAAEAHRLRGVVVIGAERATLLEEFAALAPQVPVVEVTADQPEQIMRSAVEQAQMLAKPGDVVLLAPGTASWDQFRSYAQRGDLFASAVEVIAADRRE